MTVKTSFAKDLGFSYKVNEAGPDKISFDPQFVNVGDFNSKDYISFAFKDSLEVLSKSLDPGKTLDGKTFKVYVKDLVKNSPQEELAEDSTGDLMPSFVTDPEDILAWQYYPD